MMGWDGERGDGWIRLRESGEDVIDQNDEGSEETMTQVQIMVRCYAARDRAGDQSEREGGPDVNDLELLIRSFETARRTVSAQLFSVSEAARRLQTEPHNEHLRINIIEFICRLRKAELAVAKLAKEIEEHG